MESMKMELRLCSTSSTAWSKNRDLGPGLILANAAADANITF